MGERVSNSWEYKSGGPPVPHAEAMPLDELGTLPQVSTSAETMIEKLHNAGLKVQSTGQTLQEIAENNSIEVQKLYGIIMEGKRSGGLPKNGWGRKTLSEAAETIGVTPLALQQALKQQGIEEASPNERIREIADKNGMKPSELVQRICRLAEKR